MASGEESSAPQAPAPEEAPDAAPEEAPEEAPKAAPVPDLLQSADEFARYEADLAARIRAIDATKIELELQVRAEADPGERKKLHDRIGELAREKLVLLEDRLKRRIGREILNLDPLFMSDQRLTEMLRATRSETDEARCELEASEEYLRELEGERRARRAERRHLGTVSDPRRDGQGPTPS